MLLPALPLLLSAAASGPSQAQEAVGGAAPVPAELLQPYSATNENPEASFPAEPPAVLTRPATPPSFVVISDVLVWTVREAVADNWAQEITPKGTGTSFGTGELVDAPFDWNAGFRVGLGVDSGDADCDAVCYYTHFQTQAANEAHGEVYSAFLGNFYVGNPDGTGFGPAYRHAAVDWDFSFQTLDVELGRKFRIDDRLTLRPFVGLKAASIRQSLHTQWTSPINTTTQTYLFNSGIEDLSQDFWGIGPSLGLKITAPLVTGPRQSVHLFGTPSGAVMYGNWTFEERYVNDGPTTPAIPEPTSISINMEPIDGAATMFRGLFGVEWVRYLPRSTIQASIGYEAQIWWNQMQFYSYNSGRLNNLTSLQGCVLELSVRF